MVVNHGAAQQRIEFILGAIRVVYACEMAPWKKVLGFKVTVNETDGTVQMSCEAVIETMYRTYLKGQLTYDAASAHQDQEEDRRDRAL